MSTTTGAEAGLDLHQLVAVPALELTFIVDCETVEPRAVSWAHSTEMVDPRPHLRGTELVCTVGSALITAASCARFVEAVKATDSVGICLGTGEVHSAAPRALIKECRRLSVPLLEMAHGVPFLAINDVLAEARVSAQAGTSQRDAQLVSTLLVTLHEHAQVEEILLVAVDALGGQFTFDVAEHPSWSVQVGDAASADGADADADIDTATMVTSNGDLLSWRGVGSAPNEDVLNHIGRILEISRHERLASENQSRQRLGHFFSLVGDGFADSAILAPQLLQADLVGKTIVISAWPAETAPLLASRFPAALIADAPEATFLVSRDVEAVFEAARATGLVCGHGSPVPVAEISRGIREARATLVLARSFGRVSGPESLTSLTGLLEQQSAAQLMPFVDQLVRPLIVHDAARGSELVVTLRAFLQHKGSVQATAAAQYLHANTVRHRLGQIHHITARNPLDHDDQISLTIALWAFDRAPRFFP